MYMRRVMWGTGGVHVGCTCGVYMCKVYMWRVHVGYMHEHIVIRQIVSEISVKLRTNHMNNVEIDDDLNSV